ncbi:hypothetical protein IV102_27785 [bacterium]|nr:hypothetical protein [bacterium]
MAATRVTVTLPEELMVEMDRYAENRSQFVTEAVRAELERRRKERLLQCLQHPHPESVDMADLGFREWVCLATEEDADLIDPESLRNVRWDAQKGWQES